MQRANSLPVDLFYPASAPPWRLANTQFVLNCNEPLAVSRLHHACSETETPHVPPADGAFRLGVSHYAAHFKTTVSSLPRRRDPPHPVSVIVLNQERGPSSPSQLGGGDLSRAKVCNVASFAVFCAF